MEKYDWRNYQEKKTDLYSDDDNHLIIECSGIDCPEEIYMGIPVGWTGSHEISGHRNFYCEREECKAQERWFDNQCPGCVGYFSDCSFGRAIFERNSLGLTEDQERVVKQGKCPFRTSGTLFVNNTPGEPFELKTLDLSEKAEDTDGAALVRSIETYLARYNTEEKKRFWFPWKVIIDKQTGTWKTIILMKDEDVPKEYLEEEPARLMETLENGDCVIFVWSIRKHFALRDAEIFYDQQLREGE